MERGKGLKKKKNRICAKKHTIKIPHKILLRSSLNLRRKSQSLQTINWPEKTNGKHSNILIEFIELSTRRTTNFRSPSEKPQTYQYHQAQPIFIGNYSAHQLFVTRHIQITIIE